MASNEYYSSLVTSLDKFRETDFLCDTVLVTDDKRELKAHSVVLAAASSVFRTAFESAADRGPGPLQVNLREYDSDIVELAVQFIYTGKLLLIPAVFEQEEEWHRLIGVFDRLGLDMRLVTRCEKSFKDIINIKKENILEEKSQSEGNKSLDLEDMLPKLGEQEFMINNAPSKTHSKNSKSVKRSKHLPKQSVRKGRKGRPKVSTKKESEVDVVPNGTVLSESLSSSEGTVVGRSGSRTALNASVRVFVCETCGRRFTKKEHVIQHERTHTGERPFECETCGRRFSLAGNLRRHRHLHSSQKPFMCELCGRTFIRRVYLEDHLAVHVTARPYFCSLCPKRFNSGGQLRVHFRYVHDRTSTAAANRKWHPCDVCNKNFPSKGNLRTHLRTHTGEKPFVCACGKAYAQRVQLVQHTRLHSDERPFSCETCGRSFRFRSSYLIHNRTHTGEKPHVCEQCGKSYANKAGLRTHTARVHAVRNEGIPAASQPVLALLMT